MVKTVIKCSFVSFIHLVLGKLVDAKILVDGGHRGPQIYLLSN